MVCSVAIHALARWYLARKGKRYHQVRIFAHIFCKSAHHLANRWLRDALWTVQDMGSLCQYKLSRSLVRFFHINHVFLQEHCIRCTSCVYWWLVSNQLSFNFYLWSYCPESIPHLFAFDIQPILCFARLSQMEAPVPPRREKMQVPVARIHLVLIPLIAVASGA
jgi:hypothetical protein